MISATYTPPRCLLPLLLVLAQEERKQSLREYIQRLPSALAQVLQSGRALIQAWIATGRPLSRDTLGSFEHWAAAMRGLLQTLGITGFWREFAAAWWEQLGAAETWVADLNALCEQHQLMGAVRGEGSTRSQESRLGRALKGA